MKTSRTLKPIVQTATGLSTTRNIVVRARPKVIPLKTISGVGVRWKVRKFLTYADRDQQRPGTMRIPFVGMTKHKCNYISFTILVEFLFRKLNSSSCANKFPLISFYLVRQIASDLMLRLIFCFSG